jgi:hypothetical protein
MSIEFDRFYASFKNFTLSRDDREMAEHLGVTQDEWMKCVEKKEVPMNRFLEYCEFRIINPRWLCGL